MRRAESRTAIVLAFALGCASSPSRFALHFADGERAMTAGRHAEAASAFDAAARAEGPKRERQHATYLAALELVRAGDVAGATTRFETLVHLRGEHAAEAGWELVSLHMASKAPGVTTELDDFIKTYPNDGLAYPALRARLRLARDAGGDAQALAALHALEPALRNTDSAPRVAYEIAESLTKLGKLEEARAAFISVADTWHYPKNEYFDDSLYRASEVDETLGHVPDAIADLERMLSVLESSTWPGTYVRPRFPDAGFRIAVLYRDRLGDKKRAITAFERYVGAFPNALRRDEALWEASKLLAGEGEQAAACDRLGKLVSSLPDSRYVPCAVAKCTGITRPKHSLAPEHCHAYIEKD